MIFRVSLVIFLVRMAIGDVLPGSQIWLGGVSSALRPLTLAPGSDGKGYTLLKTTSKTVNVPFCMAIVMTLSGKLSWEALSGPISRDTAICDTIAAIPYIARCLEVVREVRAPPKWRNTKFRYLASHRHICAIPNFCARTSSNLLYLVVLDAWWAAMRRPLPCPCETQTDANLSAHQTKNVTCCNHPIYKLRPHRQQSNAPPSVLVSLVTFAFPQRNNKTSTPLLWPRHRFTWGSFCQKKPLFPTYLDNLFPKIRPTELTLWHKIITYEKLF